MSAFIPRALRGIACVPSCLLGVRNYRRVGVIQFLDLKQYALVGKDYMFK